MSENTCPNVALSRNQNMWVVKESACLLYTSDAADEL